MAGGDSCENSLAEDPTGACDEEAERKPMVSSKKQVRERLIVHGLALNPFEDFFSSLIDKTLFSKCPNYRYHFNLEYSRPLFFLCLYVIQAASKLELNFPLISLTFWKINFKLRITIFLTHNFNRALMLFNNPFRNRQP